MAEESTRDWSGEPSLAIAGAKIVGSMNKQAKPIPRRLPSIIPPSARLVERTRKYSAKSPVPFALALPQTESSLSRRPQGST